MITQRAPTCKSSSTQRRRHPPWDGAQELSNKWCHVNSCTIEGRDIRGLQCLHLTALRLGSTCEKELFRGKLEFVCPNLFMFVSTHAHSVQLLTATTVIIISACLASADYSCSFVLISQLQPPPWLQPLSFCRGRPLQRTCGQGSVSSC